MQENLDLKFLAAVVAVGIWATFRHAETEPLSRRLSKTAASGLLSYGLAADVAPWVGGSEALAAVVLMAFGLLVLDIVAGLLADRELLKEIIKKRISGGGDY